MKNFNQKNILNTSEIPANEAFFGDKAALSAQQVVPLTYVENAPTVAMRTSGKLFNLPRAIAVVAVLALGAFAAIYTSQNHPAASIPAEATNGENNINMPEFVPVNVKAETASIPAPKENSAASEAKNKNREKRAQRAARNAPISESDENFPSEDESDETAVLQPDDSSKARKEEKIRDKNREKFKRKMEQAQEGVKQLKQIKRIIDELGDN